MTVHEVDAFLHSERTCRVATVGPDGQADVSPLWFVWEHGSLWLNSLVRSQRWANIQRDPRVAIVVDTGDRYADLRGVEIKGSASIVGDVPRTRKPCAQLTDIERQFAEKYSVDTSAPDGRHAWLAVVPSSLASWDFRKLGHHAH